MTLLYVDGFDHYSGSTGIGMNWNNTPTTYAPGRFGDGRYAGGINTNYIIFPTTLHSVVFGVAMLAGGNSGGWVISFGNVEITQTGAFSIQVSGPFGTYTSNAALVFLNVWNYIEVKMHAGTGGSIAVRLNGVAVPGLSDLSGVSCGADVSAVGFRPGSWVQSVSVDDFYLCDLNGSVNNDFLGDVRIETIRPNGAGSSTDWARGGTDSGTNWGQLDEETSNSDTDYCLASGVGAKDLYTATDLSTVITGTVLGVQMNICARKSDSGTRGIKSVAKVSASEADGTEYGTIATGYQWFHDLREDKPGGTGWTIADVNAMEIGMKVST